VGEKVTVELPCGTVTLAGTVMAVLLLEMPIARPDAGFERVMVQVPLLPTGSRVGLHVRESNAGVAHNDSVALWDVLPSVAVIEPVEFARTVPILALNATHCPQE
jgi:hypothetical protein